MLLIPVELIAWIYMFLYVRRPFITELLFDKLLYFRANKHFCHLEIVIMTSLSYQYSIHCNTNTAAEQLPFRTVNVNPKHYARINISYPPIRTRWPHLHVAFYVLWEINSKTTGRSLHQILPLFLYITTIFIYCQDSIRKVFNLFKIVNSQSKFQSGICDGIYSGKKT